MKLITLNTWGGRASIKNLLDFFKKHNDTDIFCLQEIFHNAQDAVRLSAAGKPLTDIEPILLQKISELLPDYNILFHPHFKDYYGLAMFVHKKYNIISEGEIFVHKYKGYSDMVDIGGHARNIQHVTIKTDVGTEPITIINFHGLWNGKGKTDTEDRLMQSTNILNFIKTLDKPYIIAGDFNLKPDTKSIKILEDNNLRNLISEYKITNTRTKFYNKPEKFADYVLVSKGIEVKDFKVLPDEVSDHAALELNFS